MTTNRDDFNPEVGDVVRIREWEDMEEEFGLNDDGNIPCEFTFVTSMEYLCGEEFEITRIDRNKSYGGCSNSGVSISKDMIEPLDFVHQDEFDDTEINDFLCGIKII